MGFGGSFSNFLAPAAKAVAPAIGSGVEAITNSPLGVVSKPALGAGMGLAEKNPLFKGMLGSLMGGGGGSPTIPTSDYGSGAPSGEDPNKGFDIGSFLESNPAYKFIQEQGLKGLQRTAASKGMFGSGNLLQDLTSFSSGLASQTYDKEIDRIMQMSGVNAGSPAAAGQNYAQAAGAGTDYGAQGTLGLGKLFSLFQ